MPELHVFTDDGTEWYIAATLDDALAAQREHTGIGPDDQDREYWTEVPDESELGIYLDEEREAEATTKTCAEWAAEKGRGFLCSTEY